MPNFWEPTLQRTFHEAVWELHAVTEQPSYEECYLDALRGRSRHHDPGHTLLLRHELQLADHVALLAHARDEPTDTSATCVEERADGLVIRLAGNSPPRPVVTHSIEAMLRELGDELKMGRRRSALCDTLFRHTVAIAEERIIQRIRPRWLPRSENPRAGARSKPSLAADIPRLLRALPPNTPSDLRSALLALSARLQELDTPTEQAELRPRLAALVRLCAAISYRHPHRSLASQLKDLEPGGKADSLPRRRDVQQIDKLARYAGLCRDMAWMASRPAYRRLFENMTLRLVQTPRPRQPPGAGERCFVHAEVQIVVDLERDAPAGPRPRAVGSSKSVCYLCDLLIREQGEYRVSHAHRTVYRKWTIPEAHWMTAPQARRFGAIAQAMRARVRARIAEQAGPHGTGPPAPRPPESRAGYPLSNRSASSRGSSLLSARTTASGAGGASTPGAPADTPVRSSTDNVPDMFADVLPPLGSVNWLLGEGIPDGLESEPRNARNPDEPPGIQRPARSRTWLSIFSWLGCFSCFGS